MQNLPNFPSKKFLSAGHLIRVKKKNDCQGANPRVPVHDPQIPAARMPLHSSKPSAVNLGLWDQATDSHIFGLGPKSAIL